MDHQLTWLADVDHRTSCVRSGSCVPDGDSVVGPGQFWNAFGMILPIHLAHSTAVLPKSLVPDLKNSYGDGVCVDHNGRLSGFCRLWMV